MFSISVENSNSSINGVIPSLYNAWNNLKSRGALLTDVFYVREAGKIVRTKKYSFLDSSYENAVKVALDFKGNQNSLYFTFGMDNYLSDKDREEYNRVMMETPADWDRLAEIYNRSNHD